MLAGAGASREPMNPTSPHPVIDQIRAAGRVHARHRGLLLFVRSLKWIVLAIPAWMLADVLFHFPEGFRLGGLVIVIAAFAALLLASASVAAFFRPPLLRMARLLESRNPALGSRLVNFLQLEEETRAAGSSELTRALAVQAVDHAGGSIDTSALPPLAREPALGRSSWHAAIAPALLVLLTLFGGPHVRNEWLRFIDPFGDHPPFSLTRLTILDPKEKATVLYGGSFIVQLRAQGHIPKELFLTAAAADNSAPPVTLPMISRGDGTFIVSLENIRHPLEITAHTGDQSSRSHRRHLGVVLTPQVGQALVRLTPPAYTGQPSRELPFRFNGVQALEGTAISFQIKSNRPLGAGKLTLLTAPATSEDFPLQPEAGQSGETAAATISAKDSGKLSFTLIDVAGNTASVIPTSSLTVTRDQPPAIAITVPEKDAFIVEKLTLPVTVDATDDYGLRSLRLHVLVNGNPVDVDPVTFEAPDTRRHRFVHPLDLAKSGAKAGDEITIFAEAIDTRPDPQLTRTGTRRMAVITEEQYNDFLRKQSDVAKIAGKYENLYERFQQRVDEQRRIEEKRRELAEKAKQNPADTTVAEELAETIGQQKQLNENLESLAKEMSQFGRENPVYDFEKELQQRLRRQAQKLRDSIARNQADNQQAGAQPEPLADAAEAHRERLEGGGSEMKEEVIEPLADLSQLHELIKDFNQFKELTEQQKELADQTKAYESKEQLTPTDKLALRGLGELQRTQAQQLEALGRKLQHDAEQAKEKFPKAASSAEKLAKEIEQQGMPSLARGAAQRMLGSDAASSHAPAKQLHEKMDALFCDACQNGQQGAQEGMDRAMSLSRGMKPGNSFQQMMQSLNFRPSPNTGGSGSGSSGMMASGAVDGNPQVIGGESFMDGPISRSLAGTGDKGGNGLAGAPTAKLDQADLSKRDQDSSRRTTTPGSGSILLEYENIADAYFRRLTSPP